MMADKRKEPATATEKKQAQHDYLQKHNIPEQVRDGLLKLIENKPAEPMMFLANYFDSISSNDKSDRIANALQVLQLTHLSQSVFQTNLMVAYDAVSVPKNANSKKSANNRPGLIGSVYEELLRAVVTELPPSIFESLLKRIACRSNEMVPFDVFRYGVTMCYVCIEFVKFASNLFAILCSKHSTNVADKFLCDATVNAYREAIDATVGIGDCDRPVALLEAGHKLRPDKLAANMLSKDDRFGNSTMSKTDFVSEMSDVFFSKVKQLR